MWLAVSLNGSAGSVRSNARAASIHSQLLEFGPQLTFSGIGLETSLQFAAEGAKVVLSDVNAEAVQKAAEQVKARFPSSEAIAVKCDVSKEDDVKALVDKAVETFGRLDVMVSQQSGWESPRTLGLPPRGTLRCRKSCLLGDTCRSWRKRAKSTRGLCACGSTVASCPCVSCDRLQVTVATTPGDKLTTVQQRRYHAPQVSRSRHRCAFAPASLRRPVS